MFDYSRKNKRWRKLRQLALRRDKRLLPGGGSVWKARPGHGGASHLAGGGLSRVCLLPVEPGQPQRVSP